MGELERLWQHYAEQQEPNTRRKLIEAYAPLARYVVDRLNVKPGPALGHEDLLSQAVVGLIDAVDRFDPTRGIKFETYAYHRIRGAVMDMLREMDWVPRSIRQKESQLAAAYAMLEGQFGRPPSDEELAATLRITVTELDELGRQLALQVTQSLDEVLGSPEWEAGTIRELVADRTAPSAQKHLERRADKEALARAIDDLPDAERTVISLYYYEGLTLKEIGRVLGVTESRVCQIHGKSVLRLRSRLRPEQDPLPSRPLQSPALGRRADLSAGGIIDRAKAASP